MGNLSARAAGNVLVFCSQKADFEIESYRYDTSKPYQRRDACFHAPAITAGRHVSIFETPGLFGRYRGIQ